MPLVVIRHARAGDSSDWTDDDRKRPLDGRGVRQAAALVDELANVPLTRILSSPYDRCVQTVEPLAIQRGLGVELRDELGEDRQQAEGVALVRSLVGEPVAVCVHGGLPEATFGGRLKKGAMLFVGGGGRVVERSASRPSRRPSRRAASAPLLRAIRRGRPRGARSAGAVSPRE